MPNPNWLRVIKNLLPTTKAAPAKKSARLRIDTLEDRTVPAAVADGYAVSAGNAVRGNLLANDTDTGGVQTAALSGTGPQHGAVVVNADGSFTFMPGPTFTTSDTFDYEISDVSGATSTATVTVTAAGAQAFEAVLLEGHTDIGLAYVQNAWDLHVHSEDTDTEYTPNGALLHVGADTLTPRPAAAAFDFLGVAAGESYYRLAQSAVGGQLLLGFGAEEIQPGTFENDEVALTLKAVNGPGHFSIWKSEIAGPVVAMATTDGVSATDRLTVPAGSHGDFNLGFSAKGRYEVTFEASAVLAGETEPTASGDVTYYFSVDSLGRIAFDQVNHGLKEGSTTTLTVRRTGGSDGPAKVAYAAVPGTGTGKATLADFTLPAGELAFGDGETVKTITFTAKTDRLLEPVERVPVLLTVPADSVAELGAAATATVSIDTPTALLATGVLFNKGQAQRSNIEGVVVTFSRDTNLPALIAGGQIVNAVKIVRVKDGAGATVETPVVLNAARFVYNAVTRQLSIGLTEAGMDPLSPSIITANGQYELRLDTALITSGPGQVPLTDNDTVKTDGVRRTPFNRLLGDFNGDNRVTTRDVPPVLLATQVVFNDGQAQRANIANVVVTFSRDTNLPALIANGQIVNAVRIVQVKTADGVTVETPISLSAGRFLYNSVTRQLAIGLTQAGFNPSSPSIVAADGRYELRLDTTLITSAAGQVSLRDNDTLKTDGVHRVGFHRLLGDLNGDKKVNRTDEILLRSLLNSFSFQRKFNFAFDLTGPSDGTADGAIDLLDVDYLKTVLFNRTV